MAESIHTTLGKQSYVVNHQGNDLEVPLPKWLDITDITNVEKVEEWLAGKTLEERLGFYHAGFDSSIIKGRAVTRPTVKTYGKKADFDKAVGALKEPEDWHVHAGRQTITKNILADMDDAIDRSLAWVPKAKAVPGSGKGTPEEQAKKAMEAFKKSDPLAFAAMMAGIVNE